MRSTRHDRHLDALEPRVLLAATFNGTDIDGDTYTVTLSGPGDLEVTTSGGANQGFIEHLELTNTTTSSKLTISVKRVGAGNGRLRCDEVIAASDLGTFSAKTCDQTSLGFLNFGRLGKLEFGDIAGSNTVTVGGGDADKVSMLFRDIGGGAGDTNFNIGARVSSLTAENMELAASLVRGADTIKATVIDVTISLSIPFNALFPVSIKSIEAKQVLSLEGEVGGRIEKMSGRGIGGSLDFGTIGSMKSTEQEIGVNFAGGAIDSITSKTSLLGQFVVDRIGSISATNDVESCSINLRVPDAKGVVLSSLKAQNILNSVIIVGGGGTPGTVKKIDVGAISNVQINQGSIETLKVKGDMSGIVQLGLGGAPVSLKSGTIGGRVLGEWDIASRIQSLTIGIGGASIGNRFELSEDGPAFDLDKLKLTSTTPSFVLIDARSVGTIEAKGALKLDVDCGGVFVDDQAIKSIKAGPELDMNATLGAGGIGSISCTTWTGGSVEAKYVGTVDVKGGGGLSGGAHGIVLLCTGTRASDGFSIKSFKSKGVTSESAIKAFGPIGTIDVFDFTLGAIKSGSTGPNQQLESDLSNFNLVGRIDKVTVRRSFSADPGSLVLRDANIMAPTFGSLSVTGSIAADNQGSIFGVGFRTLTGTIKLRDANNKSFLPTIGSAPADQEYSPNLRGPDFRIRVYI